MSNPLSMLLNLLGIKRVKCLDRKLEIRDECIAARLRKVLAHDNAQHLHLLRVWRHGVRRNDPAAFTELMGTSVVSITRNCATQRDLHRKFIILLPEILVQSRSNKRQTLAALLAHDDESQALQVGTQIIRCARQVQHYPSVSSLTQTDELVVLSDNLTRTAREVKCE